MTSRVVLFIDYQNAYRRGRDAFGLANSAHVEGQVSPVRLGQRLVDRYPEGERQLTGVQVYRGIPSASRDPRAYATARRQMSAWARDPRVTVVPRPLQYPGNWPKEREREKGIDVSLAVDFVTMAIRGSYDVGILMSTDTDLKPALEAVVELGGPIAEVAAWKSSIQHSRRLAVTKKNIWCHWLDQSDYEAVVDRRDYNIVTRAGEG